jgi:hypothetical protein
MGEITKTFIFSPFHHLTWIEALKCCTVQYVRANVQRGSENRRNASTSVWSGSVTEQGADTVFTRVLPPTVYYHHPNFEGLFQKKKKKIKRLQKS